MHCSASARRTLLARASSHCSDEQLRPYLCGKIRLLAKAAVPVRAKSETEVHIKADNRIRKLAQRSELPPRRKGLHTSVSEVG